MKKENPYDYPDFNPTMDEFDPNFYDECLDQKYPQNYSQDDENA